jgi:hypothetical protein
MKNIDAGNKKAITVLTPLSPTSSLNANNKKAITVLSPLGSPRSRLRTQPSGPTGQSKRLKLRGSRNGDKRKKRS